MPQTIDQKIVQMEFDNQRFERNISQSMNSINSLNKSLRFDSVEKGFGKLQKASETLNMTSLSSAVETVKNKFSALEVIGVTALANITNSAVNAGKKLLKSLSTDNIVAGWEKYNDITNSTQVIMSATGEKIEKVEDSLNKLNWFTDETSYNLVDMTSNIGKFTSAGVGLDDAVDAMQGIALEAALSGANAEQASRAMYNFSQSLGVGAVKLQDWMSIENANMATKEFKEVLIETAKEIGYVSKAGEILHVTADKYNGDTIVTFQNLRNTLAAGWLDSKVLTEALKKYGNFATRLQEIMNDLEIDTSTSNMLRYIDQYKKGIIDLDSAANDAGISSKKMKAVLKELSSEEYELGLRAFKAGQEAKTFKDAINATSDAVSTGWMKVFKTVGGNYEEAKVLWTNLSNDLWDIFAAPVSNLNDLLYDGFTSKWKVLTEQIDDAGVSVSTFEKYVSKAGKKYNVDVDKAVAKTGSFYDALKSGEVPITVIRDGFSKMVDDISKMNSAQLKSAGYTKETVSNLKELAAEAKNSGSEFSNLLDNINNMSGRELFISSLTNGMKVLKDSIEMVKEAYRDIFPEKTGENVYSFLEKMYIGSIKLTKNFIEMRNEIKETISDVFSNVKIIPTMFRMAKDSFQKMVPLDIIGGFKAVLEDIKIASVEVTKTFVENEGKISDILDGFFAGIDIVKMVLVDGLLPGLKLFLPIGKSFANITATIGSKTGNVVVALRDWIKENEIITKGYERFAFVFDKVTGTASKYITKIKNVVTSSETFKTVLDRIKGKTFNDFFQASKDKVQKGLVVIGKSAKQASVELKNNVLNTISEIPNKINKLKKFFNKGKALLSKVPDVFRKLGDAVGNFMKDLPSHLVSGLKYLKDFVKETGLDINKIITALSVGKVLKVIKELKKTFNELTGGFKKALPDVSGSAKKAVGGLKSVLDKLKSTMDSFVDGLNTGKIVAIAGSVLALVEALRILSKIDIVDLGKAIGAVSAMIVELRNSFVLISKTEKGMNGKTGLGAAFTLIALAESVKILAKSLSYFTELSAKDLTKGVAAIGAVLYELSYTMKKMSKVNVSASTSLAIIVMAESLKIAANAMLPLSKLSWNQIGAGLAGLGGALAIMVGSLLALQKWGGGSKKALASATSLLLLTPVIKNIAAAMVEIGSMPLTSVGVGLAGLGGALTELTASLMILSKFGGSATKIIASALTLDMMIPVIKRISKSMVDIGSLGWNGVLVGLSGLGGALTEITAAVMILGNKHNSITRSLAAAITLDLMMPVVNTITKSLTKIAALEWKGVAIGLVGLGGALTELVASLIILSKANLMAETIGDAFALLLLTPVVKQIGETLTDIGKLEWDAIKNALVGMGFALGELVLALLALDGIQSKTKKLLSAVITLNLMMPMIGTLADNLRKFGEMPWPVIRRGLVGMGVALAEVSGSLALVGKTTSIAKLAAKAIKIVSTNLMPLYEAFSKFGSMSWDEIKQGFVGMGAALAELTHANFATTVSSLGGGGKAFATASEAMSNLADAISKWAKIQIPEGTAKNINDAVSSVANAVAKFSLDKFGANALKTAAKPLGDLADSVKKWTGVTIPENFAGKLKTLAGAIRKFAIIGLGASSMRTVAKPLGDLADSVQKWNKIDTNKDFGEYLKELSEAIQGFKKTITAGISIKILASSMGGFADAMKKWADVKINKNMEHDLLHLANGISGFNWDLVASGAITLLATSFGKLANSMKKWDGVKLPENLEHDLLHLANGISGFNWELVATGVIKALVGPLGNLAGSVKKWEGVKFPTGMEAGLTDIANGVGKFKRKGKTGALVISELVDPLGRLSESMKRWVGVVITKNTTDGIAALAESIKVFNKDGKGADALSTLAKPLGDLASSVTMWKDVTLPPDLNSNLASLAEGVLAFDRKDKKASEIMDGLAGPLAKLASSVLSWSAIKVPDTIETDLTALANGIGAFSKDKSKASEIIDGLVKPIAALSDSMLKWKDVEIPKGIDTGLKALAEGLHGFSKRDKNGNEVLTGLVKPIGELAGSMSKWKDITFPSGMKDGLMELGTGLASLNWDTKGSEALSKIAKPLGDLADSASKWKNVSIPESVGTSMENLADGVASFNRKKVAAEAISKLAKPLMDLCDAAMKWSIVDIPDSVGVAMKNLSDGLNSFNWKQIAAGVISKLADPLMTLADAAMKWCLVTVPKETTNGIDNLVNSLKGFKNVDTDSIEATMNRIVAALKKFDGLDEVYTKAFTIGASIVSYINLGILTKKMSFGAVLTTALSEAASFEAAYVEVGKTYISNITAGITASKIAFSSVLTDALKIADSFQPLYQGLGKGYVTSISYGIQTTKVDFGNSLINSVAAAQAYIESFVTVGTGYATALESGFGSYSVNLIWNFAKILTNVVEATKAFRGSASNYAGTFYQVGTYCALGFINGAVGKSASVWNAFYTLGKHAYNATKKAIDAHSPSKKFGELGYFSVAGYVNEVYNNLKDVSKAGKSIGSTAMDSLKEAIDIAKDTIDSTVAPVIKPVIDMSDIIQGKKDISKTLQSEGAYYKTGLQIATSFDKTKNSQTIKLDYSGEISQGFLKEAIGDLKKEVGTLRDAMKNAKVYLDKKTVVGSLVTDMDKALGTLVTKKGKNT